MILCLSSIYWNSLERITNSGRSVKKLSEVTRSISKSRQKLDRIQYLQEGRLPPCFCFGTSCLPRFCPDCGSHPMFGIWTKKWEVFTSLSNQRSYISSWEMRNFRMETATEKLHQVLHVNSAQISGWQLNCT